MEVVIEEVVGLASVALVSALVASVLALVSASVALSWLPVFFLWGERSHFKMTRSDLFLINLFMLTASWTVRSGHKTTKCRYLLQDCLRRRGYSYFAFWLLSGDARCVIFFCGVRRVI